jgi:alanine dehydrogenase
MSDQVPTEPTTLFANADVARLIDMPRAIEALRVAYRDLAVGDATYGPRIDIFAPTDDPSGFYQWGSMAGVSLSHGVLAVRMKSDIVSWPDGATQEKYCVRPGRYCGLILVFRVSDGAPVALIQDGHLQHLRVGAAAAIGTDALARRDATTLGLLGSGGMARVYAEGIALVRPLEEISVYSPTPAHREAFAAEMAGMLGIPVRPVASPQEAVRDHDIVATATDSMGPTLRAEWLRTGTHVTCVTRRELGADLLDRADVTVQLGHASLPAGLPIPMMEWKAGGMAAYVCGSSDQRQRIPAGKATESGTFPTLLDLQSGSSIGRSTAEQITLLVNTGTQGLQFAAMAGEVIRAAQEDQGDDREAGERHGIPMDWLLQDIRD